MNIHKITHKEIDSNHNVQQRQNPMNNNKTNCPILLNGELRMYFKKS